MAWLERIVASRQTLTPVISNITRQFVDKIIGQEATGQITRVARRFALVATAGELATQFGLTGWQKGESFQAAHKCFQSWQESFGTEGNREDRAILSQIRAFFEIYGTSRFDNVREPNNERITNRAGFYKTDDNGCRVYMVLPEVFKNELCKGFESRMVTRLLLNAGWIIPAPDGKASHKPRIKGVGTPRLYVFKRFGVMSDELKKNDGGN